jgi:hypothetical protein
MTTRRTGAGQPPARRPASRRTAATSTPATPPATRPAAPRSPRTSRGRAAPSPFSRTAYDRELTQFIAEQGEAYYAALSGRRDNLGLEEIYERHAILFDRSAIDALRVAARGDDASARQARALLAFAVEGYLERQVADLTDAIQGAEARAAIIWRGERIGYRAAPIRIAGISHRTERNALDASYREAVDAINPLRETRLARLRAAMAELGYADEPALSRELHQVDVDELAADLGQFLVESETVYFAALRRYLAEIDIEQGDASAADLAHLLRGNGWDAWFDPRRLMPILTATLAGLGIDLRALPNVTLDIEPRPNKSPRAFAVPVRVPQDVRLVVQPRGGHDDYDGTLHELGHVLHYAHVDPRLPVAWKHLGDSSVTEGYAFLLQYVMLEPDWLAEHLGMPDGEVAGWLDFAGFRKLFYLRRYAAKLLFELRLHRDAEIGLARAYYAGLLGLLTGVQTPGASFLADLDDHFYTARYLRAWMLEASLSAALAARHGRAWWREPAAGETLRRSWSRGQEWNAQDVVAHLGYDRLDWRPVLRQIRTRLIGEMSGYGGPNITTRAGTRKV